MGVVHKLKDEIIQFIVDRKKNDPKLSCRSLVGIVEDAFGCSLSKSSISKILKKADPRSEDGRPSKKEVPKFSIPKERKQHIFPEEKYDFLPEERPAQEEEKQPEIVQSEKIVVSKPSAIGGILCDGMGAIFLKAAQHLISDRPILAQALRKAISGGGLMSMDVLADLLLLGPVFGVEDIKELGKYHKNGLWAINGLTEKVVFSHDFKDIEGKIDMDQLGMDFSIQWAESFWEADGARIVLEDNSDFFIDAQMTSVFNENVQKVFTLPLKQTISELSNQVINNVQTAVFCAIDPFAEKEAFMSLVSSFNEEKGKRFKNVVVVDRNGEEITSFPPFFDKKRNFIAGVYLKPQDLVRYNLVQGPGAGVVRFLSDQPDVFYRTAVWNYSQDGFKAVLSAFLLSHGPNEAPFMMIVSNGSLQDLSPKETIIRYFQRWPHADQGFNLFCFERILGQITPSERQDVFSKNCHILCEEHDFSCIRPEGFTALEELLDFCRQSLHFYCQRLFFPALFNNVDLSQMISSVYNIPGYIKAENKDLWIELSLDEKSKVWHQELEFAILRVNELPVFDEKGRKIHVNLCKK